MADSSIYYEVPAVQLIVQDKNMACWYASAMMVLNWADDRRSICSNVDDQTIKMYKANNGIQNPQVIPLAKRLGLAAVPPLCPSVDALLQWLKGYGPLWTNGKSHIVVIAGIRGDDKSGYDVKVYDPWPGNGISWRTLAGWYTGFDPGANGVSSRDTGNDVEAVFLHA
jgi:ABC-type bacteriocin/lantibiotic exporter with double-glycine peptidase domain